MKKWNKLLALLLAMVMVFGLTATSFAVGTEDDEKEDTTITDTTPTEDENKDDDTTPAEDEDKTDDTTPDEDEDKTDDTTPAEDEDKTEAAAPITIDLTGVADWAKEDVAFVIGEKKLIADRETGMEPAAVMTRAELVAALYNLAGTPAVEGENKFEDVADTASYKDAVIWAVANEIVQGTSETTFDPDGELTCQHIAVFLYRYANKVAKIDTTAEDDIFSDADDVADWAKTELSWAAANNLVNDSDGKFVPDDSVQRQQAAVILSRYIKEVLPAEDTAAPGDEDDTTPADDTAPAEGETDEADDADKAAE